mmetsp:Transcript_13416/g.39554  ORF Transcript_13416/g.39554 Transcript_13416/m.39554 type:complete len:405 (-) Transcript_13416:989-2203(-)
MVLLDAQAASADTVLVHRRVDRAGLPPSHPAPSSPRFGHLQYQMTAASNVFRGVASATLCALLTSLDFLMVPLIARSSGAAEHPFVGVWILLGYAVLGCSALACMRVTSASCDAGWRPMGDVHDAAAARDLDLNTLQVLWRTPEERPWWFARGLSGAGAWVCISVAVTTMPLAEAMAIVFTQVAASAVFGALILGERLHLEHALVLVLCIGGGVLVVQPDALLGHEAGTVRSLHYWVGASAACTAAVLLGAASVCLRKLHRDMGTASFAATAAMLFSLLPCTAVACSLDWLASGFKLNLSSPGTVGGIVLGAAFALGGMFAFSLALRYTSAIVVSSVRLSNIVFAWIWQMAFLAQPASLFGVLGACSVAAGALLSSYSQYLRVSSPGTRGSNPGSNAERNSQTG